MAFTAAHRRRTYVLARRKFKPAHQLTLLPCGEAKVSAVQAMHSWFPSLCRSQGDDVRETLRRLAESLAREALSELEGALTQSVARLYKERRSGLLAAALETLVGQ